MKKDNLSTGRISGSRLEDIDSECVDSIENVEDVLVPIRAKYESFLWFLKYFRMFMFRLGKDLCQSGLYLIFSERVLPYHIVDLMKNQGTLQTGQYQVAVYNKYVSNNMKNNAIHSQLDRSTQTI